jgi:3-hydroxyisobutyrate dehydrogenase-like beta-hydroxyacid dehydrogenase
METNRIGLIGLGLLGAALGERFLGRGFRVLGFDVDVERCAAFMRKRGEIADTSADVALGCARIVLSLPTSEVVADVLDRIGSSLQPGQTIIDTTTGEPRAAEEASAHLKERGVAYLDATVSGSSEQTRQGEVVVMAGGDAQAFAACRDLFDAFARSSFHVGPSGAGARMKLATNLVLGLNRAVLAEGLAFAQALGLDPGLALTILRASPASSRVMDTKGPKMIAGDFSPQARLSQHLKDVRLILAEARRCGALVPLTHAHQVLLDKAQVAGYGESDNSAIIRAFQPPRRSGDPPAS